MLNESLIIRIHLVCLNTALMCGTQVRLLCLCSNYHNIMLCSSRWYLILFFLTAFHPLSLLHFPPPDVYSRIFHSCIFSALADGALAMVGVSSTVTKRAAAF